MTAKAKFYWARIGDGNPEPVAVQRVDGKRVCYTFACPDPFELGRGSAVKLGERIEPDYDFLTPEEQTREDEKAKRREERYRRLHPSHGYAGFGR